MKRIRNVRKLLLNIILYSLLIMCHYFFFLNAYITLRNLIMNLSEVNSHKVFDHYEMPVISLSKYQKLSGFRVFVHDPYNVH